MGGYTSEPTNQGWFAVSVLQWWGYIPSRKKGNKTTDLSDRLNLTQHTV
ncbi:MAG: hypothetical protein IPL78_14760 [Chloroflexi bacterium]|nr:hypothetical protein [Chloroflexota bacterium]